MNRKYYSFLLVFLLSCGSNDNKNSTNTPESIPGKSAISKERATVNKEPVAEYIVPMGDPKLDRKFGVKIYETPETFKFRLEMYYDAIVENDTISFPDFGKEPVVKVKPGTEKLSCIIGFLDDKNEFREYKLLQGKDDQLRLTKLKSYVVE